VSTKDGHDSNLVKPDVDQGQGGPDVRVPYIRLPRDPADEHPKLPAVNAGNGAAKPRPGGTTGGPKGQAPKVRPPGTTAPYDSRAGTHASSDVYSACT
jgi:hypothetical protein